ncbi:MAG: 30S ribosomal protein S14 [Beggiatoa sp. IS2]|nr:MAG: 30S ribosomal protein S14 [Beggiatoa sp. IS2]
MAKKSMVNRETMRLRMVQKYADKRARLKSILADLKVSDEERESARRQFQMLPRDASPCRMRNRCRLTGRSRGYYRKFGLGRNKLREMAMQGFIPGLTKSSW